MTGNAPFSIELLRECLSYDPKTGVLTWLVRPLSHFPSVRIRNSTNANFAGNPACHYINGHGYRMGCIFQRKVAAHRAAFALMNGYWPETDIDHINGDRADNRWSNLRVVSRVANSQNARRSKRNKSGATGVRWSEAGRRWVAYIRAEGKNLHLGSFKEIGGAIAARQSAEAQYGFHPNHGRNQAAEGLR